MKFKYQVHKIRKTETSVERNMDLKTEYGIGKCNGKMELENGIRKWNLKMEFENGICKWNLKMKFENGIGSKYSY